MDIEVENHYIKQKKTEKQKEASHVQVHCRPIQDAEFTPIEPTDDPDNPNREYFSETDRVVLYVEETLGPAKKRGKKRFGYINVSMGLHTKTEWEKEDTLVGGVLVIGKYNPAPGRCEVDLHIEMVGPTKEKKPEPTTVNVQVGGD